MKSILRLLSFMLIYRLAIYLPSGWPFIVICIALRFIEGVGTALFLTAGYTLITQLYPKSTGFIVVCYAVPSLSILPPRERERERGEGGGGGFQADVGMYMNA